MGQQVAIRHTQSTQECCIFPLTLIYIILPVVSTRVERGSPQSEALQTHHFQAFIAATQGQKCMILHTNV